jgi:hypothetical protein
MAEDSLLTLSNTLIDGRFAVDTSQILLDAGGGIPAYVARDRLASDGRRVALAVSRDASPRARPLRILTEPVDNLMVPLGQGRAPLAGGTGEGYFIVCTSPPGPPVSASLNPWPERALIDLVLRPVAQVLDFLRSNKLTHRAIRPNNVFQSAPGQPVTLGAAWAAPPAMHQPVVFETPYSAVCHPAGRGDGSIADDVYALGVLLLTLLAGKVPMTSMDDATIIRWKLDQGSFAALTRDIPIVGSFGELLRGMLAEDPDHRPHPGQLVDSANLRGRRVAARPPRRSQRAMMLNDIAVFDARMLAFALLSDEKKAVQFLRSGLVAQWLRRGLGDANLATQIEDLVRGRVGDTKSGPLGDAQLVMHTIAAINPRMPLCWSGIALWPDALPALLAEGVTEKGDMLIAAEELLVNDVVSAWAASGSHQEYQDGLDIFAHGSPTGGTAGVLRLFYALNPLLPCRSPTMAAAWVATLPELMHFLERMAGTAADTLIDLHISAFVATRGDRKFEMQINGLTGTKDAESFRLGELRLLQDLQVRYHPAPMPALAKWVAARLKPDLDRWRNKPRRDAMQTRLDALAQAGLVSRLMELTEDAAARALDIAGSVRAANELATIDAEVAAIDHDDKLRVADAERAGQAIAGGIGLSAFILMAMSVLLR